jgi:hypothetical protein
MYGPRREAATLSRFQSDRFLSGDLEQHRSLENVGEGVIGVVVLAHVRTGREHSEKHARLLPVTSPVTARDNISALDVVVTALLITKSEWVGAVMPLHL